MNNLKLYIIGGMSYYDYANWILPMGFTLTKNPEIADLLLFCGGPDVHPSYYGEKAGRYVGNDLIRDKEETEIYFKYIHKNKLGICLGGQRLTVLNGYKLVQHMRHPSNHLIDTIDGQSIMVSSSHHNQFLLQPNNKIDRSPYELVGWSKKLSPFHLNGNDEDYKFSDNYLEPEIVLYSGGDNKGKSLAIQGHPEYYDLDSDFVKYSQKLIEKYFLH